MPCPSALSPPNSLAFHYTLFHIQLRDNYCCTLALAPLCNPSRGHMAQGICFPVPLFSHSSLSRTQPRHMEMEHRTGTLGFLFVEDLSCASHTYVLHVLRPHRELCRGRIRRCLPMLLLPPVLQHALLHTHERGRGPLTDTGARTPVCTLRSHVEFPEDTPNRPAPFHLFQQ